MVASGFSFYLTYPRPKTKDANNTECQQGQENKTAKAYALKPKDQEGDTLKISDMTLSISKHPYVPMVPKATGKNWSPSPTQTGKG